MDIRVGNTPAIGSPQDKLQQNDGIVEARLLAVRAPRKRQNPTNKANERRQGGVERDPPSGRVLVLLIPNASALPPAIETGAYRVFLRFARR